MTAKYSYSSTDLFFFKFVIFVTVLLCQLIQMFVIRWYIWWYRNCIKPTHFHKNFTNIKILLLYLLLFMDMIHLFVVEIRNFLCFSKHTAIIQGEPIRPRWRHHIVFSSLSSLLVLVLFKDISIDFFYWVKM